MSVFATCPYCGGFHSDVCPRVKAYEYYPNGMLKRVEFHGQETTQQIPNSLYLHPQCGSVGVWYSTNGEPPGMKG